jgi:putative ABC transport system permease protein
LSASRLRRSTCFSNGDLYVPLSIDPSHENRLNHVIIVVGRLKPGVSLQHAQAECDMIAAGIASEYPEMRDWGIHVLTFFRTFVSPPLETGLFVLLAAVGFVLLIACANIANLLLARASARQKEIAVRMALGASRSRLVRQLMVESLTLSGIGGAIGVVAAIWLVEAMNALLPPTLLPVPDVHVDATVVAFAFGLTVLTGFIFGIAPAASATNAKFNEILKTARGVLLAVRGSGTASPPGSSRLQRCCSSAPACWSRRFSIFRTRVWDSSRKVC